jgi:hypothetical protein
VPHKFVTDTPDFTGVCIDGCEDIKQMLNIHIIQYNLLGIIKSGPVRINGSQ